MRITNDVSVCGSCHEAHSMPETLHRYDPDIPFYSEHPCECCGRETRDWISRDRDDSPKCLSCHKAIATVHGALCWDCMVERHGDPFDV